ncbi:MAG: site-2 protease family protein [Syntrophobacterales bacterium]|nr:MAG: site-2 protease family protein [Syntrophobacterales bacterium]
MRTSWRIGSLFGIEIRIDSSWIIIFTFVTWALSSVYFPNRFPGWPQWQYWIIGVVTSLLFFASVLGHELTHSLVAMRQGEEVRSITLFILGGVAELKGEPESPFKEFSMAFVGPLSSMIIALFFWALSLIFRDLNQPLWALTRYLGLINLIIGIFNLIPGFPMDGGRVLRAIIWKVTGNLRRSTRIASVAGQTIAFLFIMFGIFLIFSRAIFNGLWMVFIGWFIHSAAARGYKQVVMKDMLKDIRARDLMNREFETVSRDLPLQELIDEHILKRRQRAFLVFDRNQLDGIICLDDVKAVPRGKWTTTRVGEIMTPKEKLETVFPEDDGTSVLAKLTGKNVNQVPVVRGEKVEGILCRSDVLELLQLRAELGV